MMRKNACFIVIALLILCAPFVYAQEYARVGGKAPNFTTKAYFPKQNRFAKISLSDILKQGKWVVLFFYPADFTFA